MNQTKNYFPIKVLLSYLVLTLLIGFVGWNLYSDNNAFKFGDKDISQENTKMIKVSNLLSNLYKTESFSRIALTTNKAEDLENYISQTKQINQQLDTIKNLVTDGYQKQLLDSVKLLISKKIKNIELLMHIKNESQDDASVKNAIQKINYMKATLRKLDVSDFVQDASKVNAHQMSVIKKYIEVMNNNIPDDDTNTLSQKALDSMLLVSKTALDNVIKRNSKKREDLYLRETQLTQNELAISKQLTQILATIEKDIVQKTALNNIEKERQLNKTNQTITYAAAISFLLTIVFSLMFIADFSKSQRYKEQLEQANIKKQTLLKSREQLISTVSHDIKTPLSTIIGFTELIQHTSLNSKQKNYISNIQKSSTYISNLVQDLLELNKMEVGKINLNHIPFNLQELINDVVHQIEPIHLHKNLKVTITIDESLQHSIYGDPFRLKQILTNIVGNAFKFTQEGAISIIANKQNNRYNLIIKDTGIGIKSENIEKVFEEFTQANDQIELQYGGSGLGLTIAKKMIEAMQGTIKLASEFGKGSTFNINLPLEIYQNFNIQEHQTSVAHTQEHILIIDDNTDLLFLIAEMLSQKNIQSTTFNNPQNALKEISTLKFSAIITDIQMPEMDGFQFIEALQQSEHYQNQPVIAMTGRSDLNESIYEKAGFKAVIKKPFSAKIIEDSLELIKKNKDTFVQLTQNIESTTQINLDSIKEFLSDDPVLIQSFIENLKITTTQSLNELQKAIITKDFEMIAQISHRMNPIFKQINAHQIANIIQDFELQPKLVAIETFENLKTLIEKTFEEI